MANKKRLVLGALFFALMFFYVGVYVYYIFFTTGSYTGWRGESKDGQHFYTTNPDPDGPTAALQPGDEILAINGVHPADEMSVVQFDDRVPPGTPFSFKVRRNGQEFEFRGRTVAYPPGKGRDDVDEKIFPIIYLLFLATGLTVLLLKPDNRQAWLLALMLGSFVGVFNSPFSDAAFGPVVETLTSLAKLCATWFFPLFLIFFLNFPERLPILDRYPRLEAWLYAPMILFVLPTVLAGGRLPSYLAEQYLKLPIVNWWLNHGAGTWTMGTLTAYLAAGLLCLIANYRAASPESRKRARVALAGSSLGFFMLFLLVIEATFGLGGKQRWKPISGWIQTLVPFTAPLIPISFAYAIIRYKVIPVSLIIRRGVRYVLVSRGSILIEAVVTVVAVTALLTYIFNRFRPRGIVIGLVSAAVAVAVWRIEKHLHEKYLAPVIDRKFFRQSYDSHQIIADLADSLRSTTNLSQLTEQVATKIQSALQTESVAVLLRDEATGDYLGDSSCEYKAGDGRAVLSEQQFRLSQYAGVVAQLNEERQPIEVELNSSHSLEDDALRRMKSAMLLPLAGKDGMPGIISLGPRLGDLPYSREDKRLLMSVAGPTTFAIENAKLVERMIEEARRREEIEAENEARAKELEEARQLQLSMLPKTVPQLPNLEIAAYMKTATEVGGDYYDFHLSDDGTLTVAVGDATGHGLKAGTVVTAMKSLFYSFADEPDLLPAMNRSSRVLKRMNLRSLFMSLTVLKLNGHRVRISAAGMPPVLIYRAGTRRVDEVFIKAMPLGSLSNYSYREEETAIASGDVLVLMSDGFPERFDPAGEMLDYVRAKDALAEAATRSAQGVIEHFVHVGDAWANGRPQDDDVTFVVLKVR